MATDAYSNNAPTADGPSGNYAAITPNDSTDMATRSRAIYVGTAGTVNVVCPAGGNVSFTAPAGATLPIRTDRVLATGTTASNLVALF